MVVIRRLGDPIRVLLPARSAEQRQLDELLAPGYLRSLRLITDKYVPGLGWVRTQDRDDLRDVRAILQPALDELGITGSPGNAVRRRPN